MPRPLYDKPVLSIEEQIDLLEGRGLIIENRERAIRYLSTISYYRLSGYMYHLQRRDGSHNFHTGVTLSSVIDHYKFDKQLRRLLSEYLERIEVALRAKLVNICSEANGFDWYRNERNFTFDKPESKVRYNEVLKECDEYFEKEKELFIKAFKRKYRDTFLPSNMALELLSFGKLAILYTSLSNDVVKQNIASEFGLFPPKILSSWLIRLVDVRNVCAHHGRLYNRHFSANQPLIPTRKKYGFIDRPHDLGASLYGVICLIDFLLVHINPTNRFIERFTALIDQFDAVNPTSMKLPDNWRTKALWQNWH